MNKLIFEIFLMQIKKFSFKICDIKNKRHILNLAHILKHFLQENIFFSC